MSILLILILALILFFCIKRLNQDYYILNLSKRIKTIDGSALDTKIQTIHGRTIFGNTFDILKATPQEAFQYFREKTLKSKGKSFLTHVITRAFYNVTTAEDAEEVLQSQTLITKGLVYGVIKNFLGEGILLSTDELWQYRRKLLTPAFHFKILQDFLEIFKEESHRFCKGMNEKLNQVIDLEELIPQFTLNNLCETALGVKLDDLPESDIYRKAIYELQPILVKRVCNPFMLNDIIYKLFGEHKKQNELVQITHEFSSKIIETKRKEFLKDDVLEKIDEFDKKRRYAMLNALLSAEKEGLIDHQGICDEVNTFMFEGFDTTSVCLMFTIMSLAIHQDIQQKCFEEIEDLADFDKLSVFDFNKLVYLECVIKESLRLYPSVPFIARDCMTETYLNGLILPQTSQVNVHIFDIMRDPKHFPEPNKFDPERFKPENTINRHPFAFIPFSAGPRNCIGQKFALLEVKVLLVSILKNFKLLPSATLDDLTFENGLVLKCKEKLKVKVEKRF